MIDAHPDYCGPSPSHLIRTLYNNIQNYGNLDAKYTFNIDNFSQVVTAGSNPPTVTASLTHAVPKFIVKQYTNSSGTLVFFSGSFGSCRWGPAG